MNLTKCLGLLAGAGAMSLTSSGLADSEVTNAELAARLAAAEARIAELTNPNAQELSEARAEEVRNIVYEVLADADTRASLLSSNLAAGYEDGFVIKSDDGNYSVKLNGQLQVRYALVIRDDSAFDDSTRWGFENARTKLAFSGNVFDKSWTYKLKFKFNNDTTDSGVAVLEDAWIKKTFDGGTFMQVGQFKSGFLGEEQVSSTGLLAVERSLINEEYNRDRTQGIRFGYMNNGFRIFGSWNDGGGNSNSPALGYDTELSLDVRAEAILAGDKEDWGRFKDFTSAKGNAYAMKLGGAFFYEKDEFGTDAPPAVASAEQERFGFTVDAQMEGDGWNIFGAFVWSDVSDDIPMGVDNSPWGIVLQGGLYFTNTIEGFVRYEYGDLDDGATIGTNPDTGMMQEYDDLQLLTLGVNAYLNDNIKWTTDVGFSFDEVDPVYASTTANWAADGIGDDTQVVIRSQLQLTF